MKKKQMTIERLYDAPARDIWALWTTKSGIESWWGPDGFRVEVRSLDVRPGGELHYDMIAASSEILAFMKVANAPTSTPARATFTEVIPLSRLAYEHLVDFVPGVEPYNISYLVELQPSKHGTLLRLTFDPMHDKEWSWRQQTGWEQELARLGAALVGRR